MSTAEAWPTEDLATQAVDAAAKHCYEQLPMAAGIDWADVPATVKLDIKQSILPLLWAALTNLPDPRYAAWEEGRAAGSSDTAFESEGYGTPPSSYPHENPYTSGL